MRWIILLLALIIIPIAYAEQVIVETRVEVDWDNKDEFTIETEAGTLEGDCQDVNESDDDYNDYDEEITIFFDDDGEIYTTELKLNWVSSHKFRVETESKDYTFDCQDLNTTNYNSHDKDFEIKFLADKQSDLINQPRENLTKVLSTLTNTCENMLTTLGDSVIGSSLVSTELATVREQLGVYRSAITSCNQTKKELEEETEDYDETRQELLNLRSEVETKTNNLEDCRRELSINSADLKDTKDDGNNKLMIGLGAGAGIVYFITRKKKSKPEELNEFGSEA